MRKKKIKQPQECDHMFENLAGILFKARFSESSHISSGPLHMQACIMQADGYA